MGGKWRQVAPAAGLAALMGLDVGAQTYNAIGSGGPLWWFPENDGSYSRHHDIWYESDVEALNDDWTTATSFPKNPRNQVWAVTVSAAPENSACDVQNGTFRFNVGPPYPNAPFTEPRYPGGGGFAGLQLSLQIGEWWQGMKYRGYYDDPAARAVHFSGVRSTYDPMVFGWFDVGMRDGAGTVQRPPLHDGGHSVAWINPAYSQWQLHGGGGFAMPCLGISMVQMHGVDDLAGGRGRVWPPLPAGADGGECWSSARPLVIRANSEARCEPNLAQRYPYTLRFWLMFDADPPVPNPCCNGWPQSEFDPSTVPTDYSAPYLFARRGEIATFTAGELAAASPPPVPWSPLAYPARGGPGHAGLEARFLGPNRVDPFGGASYGDGTLEVYNSDLGARECLEMGEPGWDATHGTLNVDCGHGRENSPNTGRVNRTRMGHGTHVRTREVGPLDNSVGYGGRALARRGRGLWAAPAGFEWFEHRAATLGCLFTEAQVNVALIADARASMNAWWNALAAAYAEYLRCPSRFSGEPDPDERDRLIAACEAAAVAAGRRAGNNAAGWKRILDYRTVVVPEMAAALAGGSPYGYAFPRSRLVANGRVLGFGGNACVTNFEGGTYNEALVPSYPALTGSGWAAESSIPGQGGDMWYATTWGGANYNEHGDANQTGIHLPGAHVDLGRTRTVTGTSVLGRVVTDRVECDSANPGTDCWHQFADVAGRTTPYSEAEINPGSAYPPELVRYPNFNDVRRGSTVWRDFACKTAHGSYYGQGLDTLGTTTFDHRERPNQAWSVRDPDVVPGDITATQFSSGTPCVGDDAYDVARRDGTRTCFDPGDGLGAYSSTFYPSPAGGYWELEYSGDGSTDRRPPLPSVDVMRPTPYYMQDGSELYELDLRSSFFNLRYGYRSLDVERASIWFGYGPWGNAQRSSWLRTGEAWRGVAPGWCAGGSCAAGTEPLDYGWLEHQGQLRWYGAMVPGGTGGCTLLVDQRAYPDMEGRVTESNQQILCLLPVDVGPDGKCPGENLP